MGRFRVAMAAGVVGLAAGCGSPPAVGTVSGGVTLDGEPVADGAIRFVAVDGAAPTAGAVIADGRYTADVPVGEARVEITAAKVVGKKLAYDRPDGGTYDLTAPAVPARYNTASELRYTVPPGPSTKDFALTGR